MRRIAPVVLMFLAVVSPAAACSICGGLQNRSTLRQDLGQARLVLYGTLANPRLAGNAGTTDLHVETVLKDDPFRADKTVVELPRFVPVDPKNPQRFLVFCDIVNNRLDPYRGVPVPSAAVVAYLKGAQARDGKNPADALRYFFDYLDHRDPEVAADAYLEFARASDREVGEVARTLPAERLRRLVQDPTTPADRLGLFGFLLGACGGGQDAALLEGMLNRPTHRTVTALNGLLAGYIQLRPRDGWEWARQALVDEKRPLPERLAVLGTLRFYHGWKGEETRRDILRGLDVLIPQGDFADLAAEDLRRWGWWDLTPRVLAQYGKPSHAAPIVRRALLRYALCCPREEARRLVADVRSRDPELVREVEESLQFEKAR
jgi:hypothetical protein